MDRDNKIVFDNVKDENIQEQTKVSISEPDYYRNQLNKENKNSSQNNNDDSSFLSVYWFCFYSNTESNNECCKCVKNIDCSSFCDFVCDC